MENKKDLFEFMQARIGDVAAGTGEKLPQAFIRWFVNLYFPRPDGITISDGAHDGKVDAFFTTHNGVAVTQHVVNSKFTETYNNPAPPSFYAEIAQFSNAFSNASMREQYLESSVLQQLRPQYRQLFTAYDDGRADLMFVTNHRLKEEKVLKLPDSPLRLFQLDDLINYIVDDIDGAMPRTPRLTLAGIHAVLPADKDDTKVVTSIAFARLIDFIKYMHQDPFDLLFARNVRVPISLGRSAVNRAIRDTFKDNPLEFAYSSNGITVLCEKHSFDPGAAELMLTNPRVVNGSQTLHSIRDVPNPSANARVMVRIIEIPPLTGNELPAQIRERKNVITNITVRSNQQNPMKKWSLVSSDDFQMDIYRHFRQHDRFYERRDGEWGQRSKELKSVGVSKGPSIKKLAQMLSSYYWDKKELGPARAKQSVGLLFEGKAYEALRQASPELAYQVWMVNENVLEALRDLAGKPPKYVREIKGHVDLTLLAVCTKALSGANARWNDPEFTARLEEQWEDWDSFYSKWKLLTQEVLQRIHAAFVAADKNSDGDLTFNNFFKTESYVTKVLTPAVPQQLRKLAKAVL